MRFPDTISAAVTIPLYDNPRLPHRSALFLRQYASSCSSNADLRGCELAFRIGWSASEGFELEELFTGLMLIFKYIPNDRGQLFRPVPISDADQVLDVTVVSNAVKSAASSQ